MFAAAYQRRRHVYTIVNGGPEWAPPHDRRRQNVDEVRSGLPGGDMGRIGLAIAPTDPDTVYAMDRGGREQGGLFRSTDRGVTWEKRNPFDGRAVLRPLRRRSGEQGPRVRDEHAHPGLRRRRKDSHPAAGAGPMSITTRSGSTRRFRTII